MLNEKDWLVERLQQLAREDGVSDEEFFGRWTTSTQPSTVDKKCYINWFDLIQRQIALVEQTSAAWGNNFPQGCPSGTYITEYRTVGFYAPRQTGKTTAIREFIKAHPDKCLAIYKDDYAQRNNMAMLAKECKPNEIPYHAFMMIHELRDILRNPEAAAKVNFPKDEKFIGIKDTKYVLVDDASITLNRFGVTDKQFNAWVEESFGREAIVIRIG